MGGREDTTEGEGEGMKRDGGVREGGMGRGRIGEQ